MMKNKPFKYLLFSGLDYEANGGAQDFLCAYQNIEDALKASIPEGDDWADISEFDAETGKLVSRYYRYNIGDQTDSGWQHMNKK
jgi:hypothetical protein